MKAEAVTFRACEHRLALAVAEARCDGGDDAARPARYGLAGRPLGIDMLGAAGELAAALVYGLPWTGCYYRHLPSKPADIGTCIDVRTRSEHWHDLIVHREDRDDWFYVLVTTTAELDDDEPPTLYVHGHIKGDRAKNEDWWHDPAGGRPAFFAPKDVLDPPVML